MEAAQLFSIHESVISVAKGDDATTVPFLKVGEAKRISVKEFLFSLGHRKWFLWGGGGVQRGCRKRRFCFLWSAKIDHVPEFSLFVLSFCTTEAIGFFGMVKYWISHHRGAPFLWWVKSTYNTWVFYSILFRDANYWLQLVKVLFEGPKKLNTVSENPLVTKQKSCTMHIGFCLFRKNNSEHF
jgi:hypothetical protein